MKAVYIFFVLLGFINFQSLNAQNTLSLKDCIDLAIENNINIQQSKFQEERNKVNWQQSKFNLLPSINSNINQGINLGRSIDPFTNSYTTQEINSTGIGIGAGMTLFRGLSLQNSIKYRATSWEAAEQSVENEKDRIALSVILAYLQVLSNQELLDQAKSQLTVSLEQVKRMELLDSTGAIKPSDLSDVQGQLYNDQITIARTENNIKAAKIELCRLMNIPYSESIEVEKMNPEEGFLLREASAAELYKNSVENLPSIKAASLEEKSLEWLVKSEKGRLWPTLNLGANVNTNYSSIASNSVLKSSTVVPSNDYITIGGTHYNVYKPYNEFENNKIPYFDQIKNNRYTTIFLSLQIPLFNNFNTRNNIKLAKINWREAQVRTTTAKTSLQLEIEQAWENQKTNIKEYAAMQNQVAAYETSFNAATIRFNEGVGNSVDYITTKNNLDRANSNLIITKYNLLLRTKILEFYEGKKLW